MAEEKTADTPSGRRPFMDIPELRRIDVSAGLDCLLLGLRDFRAAPQYGLFFGGIYTLGGWLLAALLFQFSLGYLAYPLAIGFAMIAPFIAAGIYEVSRRLEAGQPLTWGKVLGTAWKQHGREMGWMAIVTGFAFFIWVNYAMIIYLLFFGLKQLDISAFLSALTTQNGLFFILLGNFAGAVLALIVFSVTAISFPLLLDREIDFATAMTTSVRAVFKNLLPMIVWALIIVVGLISAFITFLVALPLVLSVLGHGTWHMYRKVVGSAVQPEAERL